MTIALIGGAGFIGTALAKNLLVQGHRVRILDLGPSPLYPEYSVLCDVCDPESLRRALEGVTCIYHLAAEHRDDVRPIQRYYDVNVQGGKNVIAAAQAHNIRTIIFTSSVALYGLDKSESRETDTPEPFNDYGTSKWQSEQDFTKWAQSHPENRLVITRLVATFGPGNRGNIFTLMDQIARRRFIMVGSGKNRKSIAYVGNVAAFLAYVRSGPPGQFLYNYADKPDLSMNSLTQIIRTALKLQKDSLRLPYVLGLTGGMILDGLAGMTGKNFPISAVRVRKFCANTIVNADRAQASGFMAPFTLEQGLQTMIAAEFAK